MGQTELRRQTLTSRRDDNSRVNEYPDGARSPDNRNIYLKERVPVSTREYIFAYCSRDHFTALSWGFRNAVCTVYCPVKSLWTTGRRSGPAYLPGKPSVSLGCHPIASENAAWLSRAFCVARSAFRQPKISGPQSMRTRLAMVDRSVFIAAMN